MDTMDITVHIYKYEEILLRLVMDCTCNMCRVGCTILYSVVLTMHEEVWTVNTG